MRLNNIQSFKYNSEISAIFTQTKVFRKFNYVAYNYNSNTSKPFCEGIE